MGTWSRKHAIASSPPTSTWAQVLETEINADRLERYRSQADAMRLYFSNTPTQQIERLTGVSPKDLPRLARKCLLPSEDGRILGFRALLPYARTKDYSRVAQVKAKFPEQKGGYAGALSAFLIRFPQIEESLVKYTLQDARRNGIPEFKLRPRDLHRIFIDQIRALGVKDTEWPLNTKYRGIRSIQRYMRDVLNRNFAQATFARGSTEARAHISVGTGHETFLSFNEPFDAVEIDAYNIECHLSVAMNTPEGTETDLLLKRLWLIAAVDRFSTAILAYTVVYRSEVTSDDILRVIREASTGRWTPKTLTIPGLQYPIGGGLPNGVIDKACDVAWTSTMFDGALAHLSNAVHERARKTLGFVINWGAAGHFERRPNVERAFNQLAKDLFKRLPSTTGSNPHNGRASDAEGKAIRHKIRAAEVEQLLDVAIAQHNITPCEGISYLTPLEALRYFLDGERNYMVRSIPAVQISNARAFASREHVTVRGNLADGRRPYIQLDRVRYSSAVLANAGHLVGKMIVLEIDDEDMRQVCAYLMNGAELGFLKAQGKWALTKHSRRTRRAINSLASKRVITISEFDDPVQIYLRHLSRLPTSVSAVAKGISPRQITEITRIKQDANDKTMGHLQEAAPERMVDIAISQQVRSSMLNEKIDFFRKIKNRR